MVQSIPGASHRRFAAPLAVAMIALSPVLASSVPTLNPVLGVVAAQAEEKKVNTTDSGLQYFDEVVGTGDTPEKGQICVMHYTGWLWVNGEKTTKFDSSVDRGTPFEFRIGIGQVIGGWDEGVSTMKVGGKRTLIIPPDLGYGPRGAGGVIPPHATLLFEVELLDIKK